MEKFEPQFLSLLDNMVEGAQIHDSEWRYLYVNDVLVSYSGYSREQLIGKSMLELYPGIEATALFKTMQQCIAQQKTEKVETEFTFPDGTLAWFELSIQPLNDGIFIHSINRSEQQKAAKKLEEINRLYAFTSAINQTIVHVNDKAELLNKACEIAIGIGLFKMAWVDLYDNTSLGLKRFSELRDGDSGSGQPHLVAQDSLAQTVLQTGRFALSNDVANDPVMAHRREELIQKGIRSKISLPLKINGKTVGAYGLYSSTKDFFDEKEIFLLEEAVGDISFALEVFEKNRKLQKSEALLEANERRFRALIEKSADMKTLETAEGNFTYASPSVTAILGYSARELSQMSAFDLVHPDDLESFVQKRAPLLLQQGESFAFQQRRRHKAGHWVWCEGTLTNMLQEYGIEALVTNFRDISDKKAAEAQKDFDANNLDALINNTSDMMWSVDNDFRLITSNAAFDEICISTRGKIIPKGSKILDGINPERLHQFREFYDRALTGEILREIVVIGDPEEMWVEISFYPIRKGNDIVGTACHSRNITAFKKLEASLQKSIRELSDYKYAIDESSIVAITDRKGMITHVNDNFCRISKYSRAELIGQDHRIINSGFHPKAFIREIWETIAMGQIWKGELRNKAKDGATYWVDTTIVPFIDEQGKPYQYIAIRSDITQRKTIEQQLIKSEEFSREVLNSLSAHIAVIDSIGDIVAVNEAWKRFGIENGNCPLINTADENNYFRVCEKAFLDGELSAAEVLSGIKEVMAKREPQYYYEYPCNSPTQERWFAMTTRPFQGEEEMIVVAHDDVSERKFAETKLISKNTELEKINFELDRFVYSVSHDLRAPLTSILGLLSIIEEETAEPETAQHAVMIRSRINRLDDFIKNILSYSKANRTETEIEPIELQPLIEEVVLSLRNSKEAECIDFNITVTGSAPFYSDKQRFTTILENLISNAIKFHDKDKPQCVIRIKAVSTDEQLTVIIEDNGIGIEPKYHSRVFEMFFRLSGKISGSGIGLYIVKEIIEKMQGTITIDGEPEKGTTFTIKLKNLRP